MIEENMKVVQKIASRLSRKTHIEYKDLLSEGYLSLCEVLYKTPEIEYKELYNLVYNSIKRYIYKENIEYKNLRLGELPEIPYYQEDILELDLSEDFLDNLFKDYQERKLSKEIKEKKKNLLKQIFLLKIYGYTLIEISKRLNINKKTIINFLNKFRK